MVPGRKEAQVRPLVEDGYSDQRHRTLHGTESTDRAVAKFLKVNTLKMVNIVTVSP